MAYIKIVQSGKFLETYEYERDIQPRRSIQKISQRRSYEDVSFDAKYVKRLSNIHRTKKSFTRIVQANLSTSDVPVFCTFTTAGKVGIVTGYQYFTEFILRMRKTFGDSFRYVAVPEFQKRGAIHFHALFWGISKDVWLHEIPYSVRILQRSSSKQRFFEWCKINNLDATTARGDRTIQHKWARGFVDCLPTDGNDKIVSYFVKYMSKALYDKRLYNRKSYVCSRNCLRPVSQAISSFFDTIDQFVSYCGFVDSDIVFQRDLDVQWLGKGRYRFYKNN